MVVLYSFAFLLLPPGLVSLVGRKFGVLLSLKGCGQGRLSFEVVCHCSAFFFLTTQWLQLYRFCSMLSGSCI